MEHVDSGDETGSDAGASTDWPPDPAPVKTARPPRASPSNGGLPPAATTTTPRDNNDAAAQLAAAQRTARVLRGEVDRLHALLAVAAPVPGVSLARLRELEVALAAGQLEPGAADPRDVKILDLAKKNRALTVALHGARAAASAAAARAEAAAPPPAVAASPALPDRRDDDAEEAEALARAKSAAAAAAAGMQAALARATRERDALAAELRATQRALAAEVAPHQPLEAVLRQCGLLPPQQPQAPAAAVTASTQGRRPAAAATTTIAARSSGSGRAHSVTAGARRRGGLGDGGASEPPSTPTANSTDLDNTAAASTGWRGRGQTIVLLRARVRALEQQLQRASQQTQPQPSPATRGSAISDGGYQRDSLADGDDGSDEGVWGDAAGGGAKSSTAAGRRAKDAGSGSTGAVITVPTDVQSVDQRAEDTLALLRASRGRQLRELEAALAAARADGEDSSRRLGAVKARVAVLEAEIRGARERVAATQAAAASAASAAEGKVNGGVGGGRRLITATGNRSRGRVARGPHRQLATLDLRILT